MLAQVRPGFRKLRARMISGRFAVRFSRPIRYNNQRVFADHLDRAQCGSVGEGDEAGRSVQHDVANGSFADWANLSLGVPDRGVRHGAQQADEVIATIAALDVVVFRIVLPFDVAEHRTFNGVAYIRRHEGVAVAPTAKFTHRLRV